MVITFEEKVYGKKKDEKFFLSYDKGKEWIEVDEKTYYVVMDNEWNWEKRAQLDSRCRGTNFNRCMNDCSKCPFEPSGTPLSLSVFEDEEYDPAFTGDYSDALVSNMAIEDFISKQDEDTKKLIIGILNNKTYDALAKELGISKSTARDRVRKKLKIFFESAEQTAKNFPMSIREG